MNILADVENDAAMGFSLWRLLFWLTALGLLLLAALPWLVSSRRPLLPGMHTQGPPRPAEVRLWTDRTWPAETGGVRHVEQTIFDGLLHQIAAAEDGLVVDFFLWNDWTGPGQKPHRHLAMELTEALLAQRAKWPDMPMAVLTDPINRFYGEGLTPHHERLAAAGILVIYTDLDRLSDSHPFYSRYARFYGPLIGLAVSEDWLNRPRLTNPFEPEAESLSVRQFTRLLHFKANHRKVLLTGARGGWQLTVCSLNPADGSSAHSNLAVQAGGAVAIDALRSELAVMRWSAARPANIAAGWGDQAAAILARLEALAEGAGKSNDATHPQTVTGPTARWVTEGAILETILDQLRAAQPGATLRIALFYLAERRIVGALREAAGRGVTVQLILDSNRDAFGREKNGVPNRPVAAEMTGWELPNLQIRWANTTGEQFHPKAMSRTEADGGGTVLAGSCNWTRRNLDDFNLEADLLIENNPDLLADYNRWFDGLWNNEAGRSYTLPYSARADSRWANFGKTVLYRIQEGIGASTF